MLKKIIIFILAGLAIMIIFCAASSALAQIIDNPPTDQGGVNLGAPVTSGEPAPSSFGNYVNRIYQFAVVIGISLAVLMIIFGGYKYMASAGDPQSIAEAKEILIGAVVGLLLILLTRLILVSIDPRLLQFPTRAPDLNAGNSSSQTK